MASESDKTSQQDEDRTNNNEVANKSTGKSVENNETATKASDDKIPVKNSSSTSTNDMLDSNDNHETPRPKARFRKGNMFINVEEANAFFNKKN